MDEISELGDWEFLQTQEPNSNSNSSTTNSNYLSMPSSEEDTDERGVDSDNPSSPCEISENPIAESGSAATESQNSNSSGEEISKDEGLKKKNGAWWEIPMAIAKFYVYKTKPVWCFSAIGVILGLVLIRRRMNRIREKKISASVRDPLNNKRISKFVVRANHVNEDMKSAPIIRTSPSSGTSTVTGTGTIIWSFLA